jgi:hypothetical protein
MIDERRHNVNKTVNNSPKVLIVALEGQSVADEVNMETG